MQYNGNEYPSELFPQCARIYNVVLDGHDIEHFKISDHNINAKDWESIIPNPDPWKRPVSSPSQKKRDQLRAKRKKK